MLVETKVDEDFIKSMDVYRQPVKGKGLIEQCSDNVVLFAEKMLGIRLYSWQVFFLNKIMSAIKDKKLSREYLALTSRQIGKSTAVGVLCLWSCVFNKYPGTIHNNTVVGVISASDEQSKTLVNNIKKLIITGDRHMEQYLDDKKVPMFGTEFFSKLLAKDQPNNATTVSFMPWKNNHGDFLLKGSRFGSVIKSYPPTSAVLGETFTIVIEDEAGKTDKIDDEFHYEYVYPTGNSTNAIRIYTSTPWVPSGFFYSLADPFDETEGNTCDRVLFTVDAIRLENEEYYTNVMKTVNKMNANGQTHEAQRAYYCQFVKGEKNYFDPDIVKNAFTEDYSAVEGYPESCDMGVDFGGQVTSKTVITISTMLESGEVRRLYHKSYEVGKDDNLLEDMEDLLKRFHIERIVPDDCPAGFFLIRKMVEKGWNVKPMNFRTDKVKKYGAFRSKLNRGKIISYSDMDLKTEMLAMEQNETARQSLIMHAPGYTDDLIDSFVMSCYYYVEEEDDFGFYNFNNEEDKEVKLFGTVHDKEEGQEARPFRSIRF